MTPISKRVKPKQIKNSSIVPITTEKQASKRTAVGAGFQDLLKGGTLARSRTKKMPDAIGKKVKKIGASYKDMLMMSEE